MRFRDAKKLHNRDQVEVCITRTAPAEWDRGYIVGDPTVRDVNGTKVVEVIVDTEEHGLLFAIPHTALR